jgi:thioredoxin 1
MSILHLTAGEFNDVISGGPVLVDFWAGWCGPCRMLAPVMEELAGEVGERVKIAKLDVDAESAIAVEYGVMSIPTVILFKDGKELKRFVGVQPKDIYTGALAPYLA